jgi:hypothetical protein
MITNNLIIKSLKNLIIRTIPLLILAAGCSANEKSPIPVDFYFMMDVGAAEPGSALNLNIEIDAGGRGRYSIYDSGGVIRYDQNDMVTYERKQVLKKGEFELGKSEMRQLWDVIDGNHFFDLTDDYRMAIGSSYAFILIEADGRKLMVDNIGMEVPEIRALVDATAALLPEGVDVEYGEGYVP